MSKAELLAAMRREREAWEQLVSQVPLDRINEPAIHGWSVKGLIGHVAYYEGWLLDWLEAAVRGRVTLATHLDTLGVDERNALVWERNRDRPWDEIHAEARHRSERLYNLVQMLPEEDLIRPGAYDRYVIPFWERSLSLAECIEGDSFGHYREHIPDLRAWLERQPRVESAMS